MINLFFELDRLHVTLLEKGVDYETVDRIVEKAHQEINERLEEYGEQALASAVGAGVSKRSPEFINELHFDVNMGEVTTDSGRMDFSKPPSPMLPHLLKNAKPMKNGSGVYKVIPIGKQGPRQKVSVSIVDTQKRICAERAEKASNQELSMAPVGSKVTFRTATSKQNPMEKWVQPAQEKNFTSDLREINTDLEQNLEGIIRDIILSYIDMF